MTVLYRLLYCSYSCLSGSQSKVHSDLKSILVKSQSNNLKASVTGGLLFNSRCFAQVLEGPQESVDHIFNRIYLDERHTGVTVLQKSSIKQRQFPAWSMAFAAPSENVADILNFDPAFQQESMPGGPVLEFMQKTIADWKLKWISTL